MGHVTALADTVEEALRVAEEAERSVAFMAMPDREMAHR